MASATLKETEINQLIGPFTNLVDVTSGLCHTPRTFRVYDLYTFYLQRINGNKANSQALFDIAESYVRRNTFDTEYIRTLCLFFLQFAQERIINQSIRSMYQCLNINPFTVNGSYIKSLITVKRMAIRYDSRTASIFRTGMIILLLNDANLSSNALYDVFSYMNTNNDQQLSRVLAQYIDRYVSTAEYSLFYRNTPLIWNVSLMKDILARFHKSGRYIKPYSEWNQRYTQQATNVKEVLNRFGTINDKAVILDVANFYPDHDFAQHFIIRNDPNFINVLEKRNDKLWD